MGFERTRRVGSRSAAAETRQHHRAMRAPRDGLEACPPSHPARAPPPAHPAPPSSPPETQPPPPDAPDASSPAGRRRALLRMDTEDDPEGAFDLIFERLRDATDASGGSAHAHNTFKALISGVEPTTPPPWTLPGVPTRRASTSVSGDGWLANRATRRVGCRISRRHQLVRAASRKSPRLSPAPGSPSPFVARVAPGRTSTPSRASATRALRDSIRIDSARWNVRRVLADPSRPSPDRRGATRARPGRTRARRRRRPVSPLPRGHLPRVRRRRQRGTVHRVFARDVQRV